MSSDPGTGLKIVNNETGHGEDNALRYNEQNRKNPFWQPVVPIEVEVENLYRPQQEAEGREEEIQNTPPIKFVMRE